MRPGNSPAPPWPIVRILSKLPPPSLARRLRNAVVVSAPKPLAARSTNLCLLGWMFLALALVMGLAYWDETRESESSLEDFATEQSTLASSLGAALSARLATVRRDALIVLEDTKEGHTISASILANYAPIQVRQGNAPPPKLPSESRAMLLSVPTAAGEVVDVGVVPSSLLATLSTVERPGELLILIRPPGSPVLYTSDGRALASDAVLSPLEAGKAWARLLRPEASTLGLPERTAFAGLAQVDGGALGRWGVAAVATASRHRDREQRARWRLVLGVAMGSGLVLVFGGLALRTQRKELDLQRDLAVAEVRNERDERLARATRIAMMGTLATGIAHEVSTPLGVILGRAEQLQARVASDERALTCTRQIVDQADRIKTLVRAFLDLARGGPPTLTRTPASGIVRSAVGMVDHRFAKAKVRLGSDIPSDLPCVRCDRALLEHAIINLLLNACEACEPGRTVEISASSDGQRVAFVVSDDGSGILPEHASRATEPFFTTKPEGQGTGLGLAIASEIVKSHRGTLTIEPRSPRGTRACIELPVAPEEARHAA